MSLLERWHTAVADRLAQVVRTQAGPVEAAAQHVARALDAGHRLFAFGTGHGHLLALELFYRAGGLAPVVPLLAEELMLHRSASRSSQLERDPAWAKVLLDRYRPAAGDVLIIASNSGRNAAPVELALRAAARGVVVIAVTGVTGSRARPSRHPSGRVLADAAEVVLDTGAPDGDVVLAVPGIGERMGPVSTLLGAFLLHAVVLRSAELLAAAGRPPAIWRSANAGGDEANAALLERLQDQIPHL